MEIVAEIVPAIVYKFPWPKSMRWGDGTLRWVRPLHSILCLFAGKLVELDATDPGFDTDGIVDGLAALGCPTPSLG